MNKQNVNIVVQIILISIALFMLSIFMIRDSSFNNKLFIKQTIFYSISFAIATFILISNKEVLSYKVVKKIEKSQPVLQPHIVSPSQPIVQPPIVQPPVVQQSQLPHHIVLNAQERQPIHTFNPVIEY